MPPENARKGFIAMDLTDEKGIHDGHRVRMRDKLVTHGQRIFDTYELLEMLLYHAIPRGDTNPLAKRLLMEFGSLDGVLCASKEELMRVSGVGECTASLIVTAGEMLEEGELSRFNRCDSVLDDYVAAGKFIVEYMNRRKGLSVACFMLDGVMRLLDVAEVYDIDFASAALRSKPFIDRVMLSGATLVIFAHTRSHTALCPSPYDFATIKMLSSDLGAVGVRVVEHYVVSETDFVGASAGGFARLSNDSEELSRFVLSKKEAENG